MFEVPFCFKHGLLYVTITLNHQNRELHLQNCIFDTGCAGTVFDTDEAAKIDLTISPQSKLKRIMSVGGYQSVFTTLVDQIIFGKEVLNNFEVQIGDLHSQFGIQGILGTDFMRHFNWQIDFATMQIKVTHK